MVPPIEQVTAQGYDLQFGTNALGMSLKSNGSCRTLLCSTSLGHFYFTKLLLPTLLAAAKTSPDCKARIINTSSIVHEFTSGLNFDSFRDGPARKKKGTQALYAQSKFVRLLFPVFHRRCSYRS